MAKRKTDAELYAEISLHCDTMRELSRQSHAMHKQALLAETAFEHRLLMQKVIAFQRLSLKESKIVIHLEKVLQNRIVKTIEKQRTAIAES